MPFHPVQVVAPDGAPRTGGGGESIEIVLQDSCSVRVPPGFAAEDLTRVLSVLEVGVGVRC